jgi:hypothetical protein
MERRFFLSAAIAGLLGVAGTHFSTTTAQATTGAIQGTIALSGRNPGNPVIRMGVDPVCSTLNAGKRPAQEAIVTGAGGGLANVFVRLQGSFPQTPVPTQAVVIDQRGCIYTPRVIGARVGQILEVRNSDATAHNVHSFSTKANTFNVGQARAGIVSRFPLKTEEVMLPIKCDIHRWMTTYVGVVSHPYFAVTTATGTFRIEKVPVGTYTIETWHEVFGTLTKTVRVTAGGTATIDFSYTAKPSRSF